MSPSYFVCQVKDSDGTVTFEAIKSTDVKKRIDQLKKDYAEACKAWKVAKKEGGDSFTDPKPTTPAFRKVVDKKICPKAKADSLAALYQEKWDELKRKKEAKADKDETPDKT